MSKKQIEKEDILNPEVLELQVLEPQVEVKAEVDEYVCPLTINYLELEKLLNGKTITEYIGKNLPENEVKRIEEDFKIYQSIKK